MADATTNTNPEQPAPQATPAPVQEQPVAPAQEQPAVAPAPEQPVAASTQGQPAPANQMPPQGFAPAAGQMPPAGQVPPTGQVPPAGQMPPQQPFGPAPAVPPQPMPQNIPGMPLLYLTGGMKFGWAALGFFVGPIAILVAWLTNAHNFPQAKNEAVKFSLIGFLVSIVGWFLLLMLFGFTACAAIGAAATGASQAAYYF